MNELSAFSDVPVKTLVLEEGRQCTLHVCTSCRPSGMTREPKEQRPGFILHNELRKLIEDSELRDRVRVAPAECLSVCPRPCGIALSQPNAWTYLFGDQQPAATAGEILHCVSLYLESADGFMTRQGRPQSMRASILGRVPPIKGVNRCI